MTVDPTLVGHWGLDEDSGTVAGDLSGNGRHGALVGDTQWEPSVGQVGGSAAFDSYTGDLDHIDLPSGDAALDNLQETSYTLSAWVRPNSTPPGSDESDNDYAYGFVITTGHHTGLWYGADQRFHMTRQFENVTLNLESDVFAPGEFHHVTAVYYLEYGFLSLYIDGNYVNIVTFDPAETIHDFSNTIWRMGLAEPDAVQSGMYAHMNLDDVRMYNRALNFHEIQSIAGLKN